MRDRPPATRFVAFVFAPPTPGGLIGLLVFFWFSITPTLLPRAWVMQAAASALSMAIGYGIGTFVGWLLRMVWTRSGREPWSSAVVRSISLGIGVAALVVAGIGLWRWLSTQNAQRDLVGMEHQSLLWALAWLVAAAVLGTVFILLGRLIGYGVYRFDRFLGRWLAPVWAHALTGALVVVLVFVLVQDVVVSGFVGWANDRYGSGDLTSPPGVTQPASTLVSGGPGSLVPWETIGYQGRAAVTGAATVEELQAFHGADADVVEPIRAYVGLASAETEEERAELAVAELERTGAFDRDALLLATVTGTGWLDPDAAKVFEYMNAGDTAIVAMQYSYLPSWISFMTDRDKAAATGKALQDAVFEKWSGLPADARPKLVVWGESLGTYGSENALQGTDSADSVANMREQSDAVLWVGPTNSNPILGQLEENREPGTPVWRPVYEHGETVRWANRPGDAEAADESWESPRALYYHHPSDPVGYWNWDTLWRPQEWTEDPVGYDVSPDVGWFPIVTWIQTVADLMAGFSTDAGFGHNYSDAFADAFSAVLPPDGWTAADTIRLNQTLNLGTGQTSSD